MNKENEDLVREFCAAWSRRDAEELLGYFIEDAIYHNMPMPPVRGRDAIRQTFDFFLPPSQEIDWELLHIASAGAIVFTERIDRFVMGGKKVELPVTGVFEICDGKIAAWRDYFDMQTWLRQTR